MDYTAVVQDYLSKYRARARRELHYYAIQRSLADAIREAALSRLPRGKRHPHQQRIPLRVLQKAERRLQAIAERLKQARSFAELYGLVEQQIGSIRGIGELAIYDIAHRIGAFLKHDPESIYLHAGTRQGARALNLCGKKLEIRQLPSEFHQLSASEIEDCLCIYESELRTKGIRIAILSRCGTS